MSYRLFFAIWPDQRVQKQIDQLLKRYEWPSATKLVIPQNWHVTLNFLGISTEIQYQHLVPQISFVEVPSFILTLDQLQYWPKAELLMLTPSIIPNQLLDLHTQLNKELKKQKLPTEKRTFEPHLTLARHVSHNFVMQKMTLGILDEPLQCWVREFCLADSGGRGSGKSDYYTVLKHWKLE